MIPVAIAEFVLIAVLIYILWNQIEAANERERQVRAELLSVLGKTETVALTVENRRPSINVKYVDDQDHEVTSRNGPA